MVQELADARPPNCRHRRLDREALGQDPARLRRTRGGLDVEAGFQGVCRDGPSSHPRSRFKAWPHLYELHESYLGSDIGKVFPPHHLGPEKTQITLLRRWITHHEEV